jgi:6-phosphogluconolactonase
MNSIPFATLDEQSKYVAEEVARLLDSAITSRGQALLAVSGGKSPIRLFEILHTQSIAWDRVTICLVDERWVPPDHDRSNEKLVRVHLMQEKAAASKFISVYRAGSTPVEAAKVLSAMFVDSPALGSGIDIAILGMGEDGHTASWFPRSQELGDCLSSSHAYAAVSAEEGRDPRVTMTLSAVAKAKKVILCVEGDVKRAVLADAAGAGGVEQYPVRAVLRLPDDQVDIRVA